MHVFGSGSSPPTEGLLSPPPYTSVRIIHLHWVLAEIINFFLQPKQNQIEVLHSPLLRWKIEFFNAYVGK